MRLHAIDRGSGPPLVLLHGVFGSARSLGVVQRRFEGSRRVIALDLRSHGNSGHDATMTYPAMAADVLETLVALGALPCDILGHSMGGKVAMRLALFHPEAVNRLIVADVAPTRYHSDFRRYTQAMLGLKLVAGLTRAAADAALAETITDRAVRAFLLLNLNFPTDRAVATQWQFGLAEIDAAIETLADWPQPGQVRFDGPTLVVAGERSDYVRPEHHALIHALFPAARIVVLKQSGHWLHADNPEAFGAIVEAFLAAPPGGQAVSG